MSVTYIPTIMKMEVLERDGWNCLCCGRPMHRYPDGRVRPDTLSFDHKLPEKFGGPTTVDNLQVLCMACNLHKGVDTIDLRKAAEDFRREYVPALAKRRAEGFSSLMLGIHRIGPVIWSPSLLKVLPSGSYTYPNLDMKMYKWFDFRRDASRRLPCPIRDAGLPQSVWDKRMEYSQREQARYIFSIQKIDQLIQARVSE